MKRPGQTGLVLHNMAPTTFDVLPTGNVACMGTFFADDGFGNFLEVEPVAVLEFFLSDREW